MIDFTRGVLQAGLQVLRLQVRKFLQDLLGGQSGRHQVQNIRHADSHTPYAGPAPALFRVDSDPRTQGRHAISLAGCCGA